MNTEKSFEQVWQQVTNFVRRYTWMRREGFFEGFPSLNILEAGDDFQPIIDRLIDELHVEPDEAREAYSQIMLNGAEDKFKLPALTAA